MRKKIAELPPPSAPKRSEPDDRLSGGFTKETHDLKFEDIEKNDIAGAGLVFGGVTTLRGKSVDAVITASNYAAAVPSKTGLKGKMGNINLDSNTEAEFTMKFVDSDTNEPVELGEFLFSVFDMDTGLPDVLNAKETLTISGWSDYYLIPPEKGGQLAVTSLGADSASFTGTTPGVEADNPSDPMVLTANQAQRTVNFKFKGGLSQITWKYKVTETIEDGRNFQFAGMTNLYFCKAPKVNLDFEWATVMRSNLGNRGPQTDQPEGVYYHNIAAVGSQIIDMEINAVENYDCCNCKRNGKYGQFGQVNLMAPLREESKTYRNKNCDNSLRPKEGRSFDGSTKFKFSLYKAGTTELYTPDWLYWSMFDLDNAKPDKKFNPKWQESFSVEGFSTYSLSDDTEILTEQLSDNKYRFNSSQVGNGKDNPNGPMNMTQLAYNRAITFVFRNTGQWSARFTIGVPDHRQDGRNFLFAGKSSTAVCDKETYGDVTNVPAKAQKMGVLDDPHKAKAEEAEKVAKSSGVMVGETDDDPAEEEDAER